MAASHRGTKAAGVLLRGVIAEARENGIERLEPGVDPDNHRAIRFCEHDGVELYGRHPDVVRMNGMSRYSLLYRLKIERSRQDDAEAGPYPSA